MSLKWTDYLQKSCDTTFFFFHLTISSQHRECTRGGFCNFMHLKLISRELRRELYGRRRKRYRKPSSSKASLVPFVKVDIFVVVTEIIFPLDIVLGQDLVKDALALVTAAVEVVNARGEDQEIVNVLEDFEPWQSFAAYVLLLSVINQWPAFVRDIKCHRYLLETL